MKKTRIFAILALVLCCLMVFASCSDLVIDYYNTDYKETLIATTSTKTELEGTLVTSRGNLVIMRKGEVISDPVYTKYTYKVYDLASGTVVLTVVAPDEKTTYEFTAASINGIDYFVLETYVDGIVTKDELYSAAGTAITTYEYNVEYDSKEYSFVFGDALYSFDENKAIVKVADVDGLSDVGGYIPGFKYNYIYDSDGYTITDKDGEFVTSFKFKRYYEEREEFILANGDIAVQYLDILPEDATEFDIFYDDKKIDIITEIYDVSSEKTKVAEVDFFIEYLYGGEMLMGDGVEEGFDKNIAYIYPIVDQRLDESNDKIVILDNSLNIDATLDGIVKDATDATLIGDDRFVISDIYGNRHFVYDGDVYKTVTGSVGYNEKYIYTDYAIYDMDFNKVYDLKANKYTVEYEGTASLLLSKEVADDYYEYAIYTNAGTLVTVATDVKADIDAGVAELTHIATQMRSMYRVTYTKTVELSLVTYHDIYNDAGTKVATFTTSSTPTVISTARNGAMLIGVYNSEKEAYDYYRFA